MNDEYYRNQYEQLNRLYRTNPRMFNEDQVDSIERLGSYVGERFQRDPEAMEFSISNTISQLATGFLSGFTTIQVGEAPSNTPEAIARNVGSLMGFLGVVPGIGTGARFMGTAIARTTLGVGGMLGKTAQASGFARKAMKGAEAAGKITSIPMMVGGKVADRVSRGLSGEGTSRALKFLSEQGRERLTDSLVEAARLGTASATASWQGGVDDMIQGFSMGALEGGVFRGIANMEGIGKMIAGGGKGAKQANMAVRMISSSLYGGGLSAAYGDPWEMQIYHYLLGAYFGKTDIPLSQRKALKFLNGIQQDEASNIPLRERLLDPTKQSGFDELNPIVQDEVISQAMLRFGRNANINGERMRQALETTEAGQILAESLPKTEAFRDYMFDQEFFSRYNQKVDEDGMDFQEAYLETQTEMDGWEPGDFSIMDDQGPVTNITRMDIARGNIEGAGQTSKDILQAAAGENQLPGILISPLEQLSQKIARTGKFDADAKEVMKVVGESASDIIGKGGDYSAFREFVKVRTDFEIQPDSDMDRSLKKTWVQMQQNEVKPQYVYDTNFPNSEAPFRRVFDTLSSGEKVAETKSTSYLEKALGEGSIAIVKKTDDNDGNTQDLWEYFVGDGEAPDPGRLNTYLYRAAANGRPFLAGNKDKGTLLHSQDGWLFDTESQWYSEFNHKLARLEEMSPGLWGNYVRGRQEFKKSVPESELHEGLDAGEAFDRMYYNNMLMMERLNGLPMESMVQANQDAGFSRFVLDPTDLNKRMQPIADGAPHMRPEDFQGIPLPETGATPRRGPEEGVEIRETIGDLPGENTIGIAALGHDGTLYLGQRGDAHINLLDRYDISADDVTMGFADEQGNFMEEIGGKRSGFTMAREEAAEPREFDGLRAMILNGNPAEIVGQEYSKITVQGEDGPIQIDAEQVSDGITYLHPQVFDAIAGRMGNPRDSGFQKGTIVGADGENGMIIGKQGLFKAPQEVQDIMEEHGASIIMYDTAAKQIGLREKYDFKINENGKVELFPEEAPFPTDSPKTYRIDPDDIRINLGVYEKPPENTKVVKQFLLNLQGEGARSQFYQKYIEPSIKGDPTHNRLISRRRDLSSDDIAKMDIDQVGIPELLKVLTEPGNVSLNGGELYSKVLRHILGENERVDSVDPEQLQDPLNIDEVFSQMGVDDFNGSGDRIVKVANELDILTPAIANRSDTHKYIESAIRKYVVNRMVRPQIPYSGKAVMYGQDAFLQKNNGGQMESGTFQFAEGMRDMKVKWLDGEEVTLGEAWDQIQAAREEGSERLSEMETALEYSVIRVPADSPSGTRQLKFGGFSGRDGWGIHLNPDDMINLGGADNDGDSVFFYQDLDGDPNRRPIADDIRRYKDQWLNEDGTMIDSKANEDSYRIEQPSHLRGLAGGMNPRSLLSTHLGSTLGNKMLGPAANMAGQAIAFRNAWQRGDQSARVINRTTRRGDEVQIRITGIDESLDDAMRWRREYMNAAADATAPMSVNKGNVARKISDQIITDYEIYMNGDLVRDPAEQFRLADSYLDIRNTDVVRSVMDVNSLSSGYTTREQQRRQRDDPYSDERQVATLRQTLRGLESFATKNMKNNRLQPVGNLYFDALMKAGQQVQGSWRPTRYEGVRRDGSQGDDVSLFEVAPYVNRDAGKVRDMVNRFFNDQDALAILDNSGIQRFQIGNPEFGGQNVRYRNHWQFQNDMTDLTSLFVNHMTAKRAREAGTSGRKLAGIRQHVDAFKYHYNKFTSRNDYAKDRNRVLKEGRLGWRGVRSNEDAIARTEKYAESLSPQEKAYYDAYMMGSLSEQRFSKDEIARFEYIIRAEGLQGEENAYTKVRQILNNDSTVASRYSHVDYDFISKDIWKIPNETERNQMLRLRNRVDSVWQNKNSSNVGFTLSHINSTSIGNFLKVYNGFTQNDPSKTEVFREISDPASSRILEEALLQDLPDEARQRFDQEFVPGQPGDSRKSLARYLERYDTSRPVERPEDAKAASEQPIYRKSEYGQRFAELYRRRLQEDEGTQINLDATTEEGKRNRHLLNRLENIWKDVPDHITRHALELFEGQTNVTPERATLDDLRGFINYMESFKNKTFLERAADALGGFRNLDDGVKWYHWLFMPETIARRMGEFDINLSQEVMRPVYTNEGVVSKEVREVFSTFERVRRVLSAAEEQHSAITARNAEVMDSELGFMNSESILPDKGDLFEIAIAQREDVHIKQRLENMQARNPEKDFSYAINVYQRMTDQTRKMYERVADKRYSYKDPKTGETVTLTGKDLVGHFTKGNEFVEGRINEAVTRMNEIIRDTYINPDGADQFIARRDGEGYVSEDGQQRGVMDPVDTIRRMGDQFSGTTRDDERIANIGLNNMYELANELSYLYNYTTEYNGRYVKPYQIENLEDRDRIVRDLRLKDRGYPDGDGGYMQENGVPILRDPVRLMRPDAYFPHMNHPKKAVEDHIKEFYSEGDGVVDAERALKLKRWHAEGMLEDAGMSKPYIEALFSELTAQNTRDVTINRPYGNLSARSDTSPLFGWERSIRAYEQYMNALSKTYHNLFGVVNGQHLARSFREKGRLGEMTESWGKFLDIQIQDFTGQPSTFPSHYFADQGLNLKRSPYYLLTDHYAEDLYNRISKKMGLAKKDMSEGERVERGLQFQNRLNRLTTLEGKYSLMTLLANTRSMMNNYVGGTAMTAISSGWNSFRRANSLSYIRNNIDPSLKTWSDVQRFAIQHGAVESWMQHEVQLAGQTKGAARRFTREIRQKLLDDPDASEKTLMEIARRNGVTDSVTEGAAWFMRKVERELRVKSWLAHYIKARDTLMVQRGESEIARDDPWLIDMAQKGVWGTQFLYNSANRPAIARTNLGRVFTRFQLWSWNSIKFRRDITTEAAAMGFQKNTPEFQKFQRMMQADLFMFALAAAFPMSMFESVLPSPWNYLEDFSDYFFGDPEERDRAFFGTIPYPFNPVQAALPPASRIPFAGINSAIAMISDEELDNRINYQLISMIPFGLLTRNAYRSAANPAMTVDFMTGVPLHRVNRQFNQMKEERGMSAYGLRDIPGNSP